MMKAAVLHEYKQPLVIESVEQPTLADDEVLLQVEACGVCHSDLHIAEGDWQQLLRLIKKPLIPGHEVVGRVVARGEAVTELEVGDRAGVAWVYWTCGQCDLCRAGQENLCRNQLITGAMVDGGYAEFIRAKASHALRVPEALSSAEAAPLFCAGVTVYRAVKRAEIAAGERLAVFGIGGLGHLAVQIARHFGAEVIAVDVSEEKLALARSFGAEMTINAAAEDPVKALRKLGGVQAAVVTSGAKAAYDAAFYAVRPGGKLVVVGMPAEPLTFPAIMMREITITSAATGTRQDLAEVLQLAAEGKLRCLIETDQLDRINEIFDAMRAGKITGRVVLTF
ncbi:MAG TPA: alcohol dehydrogenase catalytic domain-containing protein [Blastocatellia bacterium]|nr:alcohol dehydrogenase catalytic domain-containing protein [Blastocatellia bacterium]